MWGLSAPRRRPLPLSVVRPQEPAVRPAARGAFIFLIALEFLTPSPHPTPPSAGSSRIMAFSGAPAQLRKARVHLAQPERAESSEMFVL